MKKIGCVLENGRAWGDEAQGEEKFNMGRR
jgi:hypothetical protein